MKNLGLEVRKDDLSKTRIVEHAAPPLNDGEVSIAIERFGLTANNITYGVVGEAIGYWQFFPSDEPGWGNIPVWATGEVTDSEHPQVSRGERFYGYFPMASRLVIRPDRLNRSRVVDGSAHRAKLPPVYNSYLRLAAEPGYDRSLDDLRVVLFPLYGTAYCLYDFLLDNQWFGASQLIVVSASSKTAIGLAYALHDDVKAPASVGLTSPGNADSVKKLGLYDSVATYDGIKALDATKPTVIVDMSGSGAVLSALAAHLGENMRYCSNVGVTHHDAARVRPDTMGGRSAFFFAPSHIKKRADEWGPGELDKRVGAFFRDAALRSRDWLRIEKIEGAQALERIFHELRLGKVGPERGLVATL